MKFSIASLILLLWPGIGWTSGTVIRNGGDPIFYFLEATRYSLVETVRQIQTDPEENGKFCNISTLDTTQISYCRQYFFAVANQLMSLNQGAGKTLFVLRLDPLLVEGPDGKPMPVAARTALGPHGEVEFHRDSIKLMPPDQVLFLMAHEFQHKALYENRSLTDNEVLGPFRNGRELLDTVAGALVEAAKRKGKVGSQYGLRDSFDCKMDVNGTGFGVKASSPRMFLSPDLMSYESSLSKNPGDALLYVPENNESDLYFRVQIREAGNCSADPQYNQGRGTHLQIVRVFHPDGKGVQRPDQVVSQTDMGSYNPLCIEGGGTFSLSYQNVDFNCHYYGTEGTTSSAFSLKTH
jgi:hypothetical protein